VNIVVVAAVIERAGQFLVTRRQPGVHLAGMWEFPGGKIDPDESHRVALEREIREELDVDIELGELVHGTTYAYADRIVELYFYRCALLGNPRPLLGQELRWVARADLGSLPFPPADTELIELLLKSDVR
jgi:mutator protein MutT